MSAKREKKTYTEEQIKEILGLPPGEEGAKMLNERIASLGAELTEKEKLFIIAYTSPNSKFCGKISDSGDLAGGSWRGYGSWALQQPHVKKIVRQVLGTNIKEKLEDFFMKDIQANIDVIQMDRSSLRKDYEFTFVNPTTNEELTVEKVKDKAIKELSKKQKMAIADYTPDKDGILHPVLESRGQARVNLMNYYKLLSKNAENDSENKKSTETVVTLEGIKDKATAKIRIIQHNGEEAEAAGEFIGKMIDQDEEE